jgi:heme/copper-type cytochrome/quinol oxidase subunit 2
MRALLRSGTGALLALSIMFIGSIVLWLGTPLLWIWVGSQIQGATQSVASALAAMFVGVLLSIMLLALVLVKLSTFYRANHRARGLADPGNRVLEAVLVVSAAVTLIAFAIWFLFIAGASPVPGMGVQL